MPKKDIMPEKRKPSLFENMNERLAYFKQDPHIDAKRRKQFKQPKL